MFNNFIYEIKKVIPHNQIILDEMLRYAYSTDASLYRLVPRLVIFVKKETEVRQIIKSANTYDLKLTFRAAGTSLSGQAVTDQILVILANDSWQNYYLHNNARTITLEPGIIGAQANTYLKSFNKEIGPDPASINTAKIGGIIANNSSGMCCGTAKNSYATLENIRAVLADGNIFDTSSNENINHFRKNNLQLLNSISKIRAQIVNDSDLVSFISKKFSIKNTSGYSLNAFLDYEDPIQILERLLVGSEGTLGFISNVTLKTINKHKYKALNVIFGKLSELVKLTVNISNMNISAVELLDYTSLKSVANKPQLQNIIPKLEEENFGAIIIEISSESEYNLNEQIKSINAIISKTAISSQNGFTTNEEVMTILWQIRKGILPAIAGDRPLGSTVIIEDVAVEIKQLPNLIQDIQLLLKQHDYNNAAIFGHVLAGNIHFVLTPVLNNKQKVINYDSFMHKLTKLVAHKYKGSLKAEHGSGRNISPFAIVEWGKTCWDIMWQIKNLLDPKNILNPDVKLTKDHTLHTQNLKQFNSVDEEIDRCMECGFCEPICPSRKLSLTPRQRNSVARKIASIQDNKTKQQWLKTYNYYAIETCATTGLCKTSCPVDIDTGSFILKQKPKQNKLIKHSQHINQLKHKVALGDLTAKVLGKKNLHTLTTKVHSHFKSIPVYLENTPNVQKVKFQNSENNQKRKALLLPSCPNRIFSNSQTFDKYPSQLILEKIGYSVHYPDNNECCGQMYHSQNNLAQQQQSIESLEKNYHEYDLIVSDNSSCSSFSKEHGLNIIDINQLISEKLNIKKLSKRYHKIALHLDCSTLKQNFHQQYISLLELCCNELVIPNEISCCGFAGDKGFNTPELNASSLSNLASQVNDCDIGVTFNRSCQIGLSYHSNIEYISFIELILACLST